MEIKLVFQIGIIDRIIDHIKLKNGLISTNHKRGSWLLNVEKNKTRTKMVKRRDSRTNQAKPESTPSSSVATSPSGASTPVSAAASNAVDWNKVKVSFKNPSFKVSFEKGFEFFGFLDFRIWYFISENFPTKRHNKRKETAVETIETNHCPRLVRISKWNHIWIHWRSTIF